MKKSFGSESRVTSLLHFLSFFCSSKLQSRISRLSQTTEVLESDWRVPFSSFCFGYLSSSQCGHLGLLEAVFRAAMVCTSQRLPRCNARPPAFLRQRKWISFPVVFVEEFRIRHSSVYCQSRSCREDIEGSSMSCCILRRSPYLRQCCLELMY